MGIFSYPVTVAYDELKTECGIDLIQEIGKEKERSFMNGINRAVYDGCIYLTGASDLKDRIIQANPDCATGDQARVAHSGDLYAGIGRRGNGERYHDYGGRAKGRGVAYGASEQDDMFRCGGRVESMPRADFVRRGGNINAVTRKSGFCLYVDRQKRQRAIEI